MPKRLSSRRRVAALHSVIENLEARRLLAFFAPDVSFGSGGEAPGAPSTDLITQLSDGKLLVIGHEEFYDGPEGGGDFSHNEYYQTRLNADGTIDKSFGTNGVKDVGANAPFKVGSRYFTADYNARFTSVEELVAYDADFNLLTSYGDNGRLAVPHLRRSTMHFRSLTIESISAAPDGDMIVRFRQSYSDAEYLETTELVKLNPDGTVDTAFGDRGYYLFPKNSYTAFFAGDAFFTVTYTNPNHELRKFKADGVTPDTTFGGDGIVTVPHDIRTISMRADGKVLYVSSRDSKNRESQRRLFRLKADGSPDTSFGERGNVLVTAATTKNDYEDTSYLTDPQKRIWVFTDGTLFRFSDAGVLEGAPYNGTMPVSAGRHLLDSDGRILAGGYNSLTRYDEAGPIEIGRDNVLYLNGDDGNDIASVTLGTDGRLHASINDARSNPRAKPLAGVTLRLHGGDNVARVDTDIPATIVTGDGNDTIVSSSEDDTINAGIGVNVIDAGDGDDSITVGLSGSSNFAKPDQRQRIAAGDGDKTIVVRAGGATIDLGTGNSNVEVDESDADNTIRIAGGNNKVSLEGDEVTLTIGGRGANNIEMFLTDHALINTGDGPDTFLVSSPATINSRGGNDTFTLQLNDYVEPEHATIDAGAGNDRFTVYSDSNDGIGTFRLGPGNDYFSGGDGSQTVFGDAGNDTILGNAGNDVLYGGTGQDRLEGGAGNDTLTDADGTRDFLFGGKGSDRARGDRKIDRFDQTIESLF